MKLQFCVRQKDSLPCRTWQIENPWGMYYSQTSHSAAQVKDPTSFVHSSTLYFCLRAPKQAVQQHHVLGLYHTGDAVKRNNTSFWFNFPSRQFLFDIWPWPGFPCLFPTVSSSLNRKKNFVVHQLFDHKNELLILLRGTWLLGVAASTQDSYRRWSCLMS